jgi:hypothetical protein
MNYISHPLSSIGEILQFSFVDSLRYAGSASSPKLTYYEIDDDSKKCCNQLSSAKKITGGETEAFDLHKRNGLKIDLIRRPVFPSPTP